MCDQVRLSWGAAVGNLVPKALAEQNNDRFVPCKTVGGARRHVGHRQGDKDEEMSRLDLRRGRHQTRPSVSRTVSPTVGPGTENEVQVAEGYEGGVDIDSPQHCFPLSNYFVEASADCFYLLVFQNSQTNL